MAANVLQFLPKAFLSTYPFTSSRYDTYSCRADATREIAPLLNRYDTAPAKNDAAMHTGILYRNDVRTASPTVAAFGA